MLANPTAGRGRHRALLSGGRRAARRGRAAGPAARRAHLRGGREGLPPGRRRGRGRAGRGGRRRHGAPGAAGRRGHGRSASAWSRPAPATTSPPAPAYRSIRWPRPTRSPRPSATARFRSVDLARMTGTDGEVRWFGAVLAAGFDAIVNERANRMRWPRGPRRYDLAIALEMARLRPRVLRAGAGRRRPRLRRACWWRSATARATAAACASCPAPTPPTGCWTWWSRRRSAGSPWPGSSRGCAAARTSTDPRVHHLPGARGADPRGRHHRVRGRRTDRAAAAGDPLRTGCGPVAASESRQVRRSGPIGGCRTHPGGQHVARLHQLQHRLRRRLDAPAAGGTQPPQAAEEGRRPPRSPTTSRRPTTHEPIRSLSTTQGTLLGHVPLEAVGPFRAAGQREGRVQAVRPGPARRPAAPGWRSRPGPRPRRPGCRRPSACVSGSAPTMPQARRKIAGSGLHRPTSKDSTNASTSSASPQAAKCGRMSKPMLLTTPTLIPAVVQGAQGGLGVGVRQPAVRAEQPFVERVGQAVHVAGHRLGQPGVRGAVAVLVQVAVGPVLGQVRRHPVRQRPAGPARP